MLNKEDMKSKVAEHRRKVEETVEDSKWMSGPFKEVMTVVGPMMQEQISLIEELVEACYSDVSRS